MSLAQDYAAAYAAWYAEKAALEAPWREWWHREGSTLPSDAVGPTWRESEAGRTNAADFVAWRQRCPTAPMYWVNSEDPENYIGVGTDGALVFMPVRDAGGEAVALSDIPQFRAWLHEVYD